MVYASAGIKFKATDTAEESFNASAYPAPDKNVTLLACFDVTASAAASEACVMLLRTKLRDGSQDPNRPLTFLHVYTNHGLAVVVVVVVVVVVDCVVDVTFVALEFAAAVVLVGTVVVVEEEEVVVLAVVPLSAEVVVVVVGIAVVVGEGTNRGNVMATIKSA